MDGFNLANHGRRIRQICQTLPLYGIALTVIIHLSGLVVEYWPFVGACGRHSHSKLYHCIILLLQLF